LARAMEEAYEDKPDMMIPIYDRGGNLLWPKQMSHADVQQFVAKKSEG